MPARALLLTFALLSAAHADSGILRSTPTGKSLLPLNTPALATPAAGPELLDPQQAFIPLLSARSPDRLSAEWTIADGYYLYRDKFTFTARTPGIALGEPQLPSGRLEDDEFYGQVEVYRDRVRVELPLLRTADTPADIEIELVYQGCAEVGVCFLPQTTVLPVHLAATGTSP